MWLLAAALQCASTAACSSCGQQTDPSGVIHGLAHSLRLWHFIPSLHAQRFFLCSDPAAVLPTVAADGQPVATEEQRFGLRVAVLGLPAHGRDRLRRLQPVMVATIARGSSDHAAAFLKYAIELTAGVRLEFEHDHSEHGGWEEADGKVCPGKFPLIVRLFLA